MADREDTHSKVFETQIESSPGGVLAALFRKIMKEGRFIPLMDILTERYLNNASLNNVSAVRRKTKSTLKTNITSGSITFKTFVDLVFYYLGAKKLNISIKLTFANGTETVHSVAVLPTILNTAEDAGEVKEEQDGTEPKQK